MIIANRNRATAGAVALGLAVAGAVVVLPARAATSGEPAPIYLDAGTVTLYTGVTDQVTYAPPAPADSPAPQVLTGRKRDCGLTSSGPSLLKFSGSLSDATPFVGFYQDSIGVVADPAGSCNMVDAPSSATGTPEVLEVSLGDALTGLGGVPLLAKSATLDLEVKQYGWASIDNKAEVLATILRDGTSVGTATLVQGAGPTGDGTTYCDVSDTHNCSWNIELGSDDIPIPFDTIQLKAVKGAFSLEGGSDSKNDSGAKPTTFDLVSVVDAMMDCGDNATLTKDGVSVTRLANADPSDNCTEFGATLSFKEQEIHFLKPFDIDPSAQFIVDVDWSIPPTPDSPAFSVPTPKINFEDGSGFKDMGYCPTSLYDETELKGVFGTGMTSSLTDMLPAVSGVQFACVGAPRSITADPTGVKVKDKIYLLGDARMRL
jgi:hypothetical protein